MSAVHRHGDQRRAEGASVCIALLACILRAHHLKARNHDSNDPRNIVVVLVGRLEGHLHLRCFLAPEFEAEPAPVQHGTHHIEVTNVVLVIGFKVAEATVVVLELPLDEYVTPSPSSSASKST